MDAADKLNDKSIAQEVYTDILSKCEKSYYRERACEKLGGHILDGCHCKRCGGDFHSWTTEEYSFYYNSNTITYSVCSKCGATQPIE
jgi:hypothetical protein